MKKKVFLVVMSLSIMMLAMGCGKKDPASELNNGSTTNDTTASVAPTAAAEPTAAAGDTATDAVAAAPEREAYEVSDYITLGEYKGLTVTYTKLEVKDEDVDAAINEELQGKATQEDVTDRAVQDGDIVNIDYEGLKDGVAFDGGTATGYDLTIGSSTFIEGFETGLIGKKIGEKVTLNLTFPADYSSADLAGKAVVFNVTINSIKTSVVPELTEDYVKNNTDYASVDAYKEAKRADLVKENEKTMKNEKINNLLTAIVDGSKITSYPQTLIDYYAYEMESYYTQYASMFGYTLADFLTANKMTEESFATEKQTYAESRAAQELVLNAVIKAEGMKLSDQEYTDGVANYVKEYNYTSEDELFQNATEAQIRESLIWEKAVNFILENSKEA